MKKNLTHSLHQFLLHENDADIINTQILEECFEVDEKTLFSNELVLKTEFEGSEFLSNPKARNKLIQIANSISRSRKNKLYEKQKAKGKLKILAEGDSWFEYPLRRVEDTLDHLGRYYAVKSIAGGGDELRNMFGTVSYKDMIRNENPSFFLLSAGGNDFLGSNFETFINDKADTFKKNYLKDLFYKELESISLILQMFFKKILQIDAELKILIHGYDYVIPTLSKRKRTLGSILHACNITDPEEQRETIKMVIDEYNEMLEKLCSQYKEQVYHIDLRNTIKENQWYDEIHPNSKGYLDLSIHFMQKIEKLSV